MHLLKAQPGVVADGSEAVDLGQAPGDIAVLSAADTELASLAAARGTLGEAFPSVRLANLMQLSHNASVDLYCEEIVAKARLVIVHLLGGKSYWPYGVEQIVETCAGTGATLVLLPGDDQPDPELAAHSTAGTEAYQRLWNFLLHGGAANARSFLAYAASLIGRRFDWREPAELPRAGIYWPGLENPGLSDLRRVWANDQPVAALVFYRALVQADNVAPVRALVEALADNGVNCLPVYCTSLKDPVSAGVIESLLAECEAGMVLNGTGFAVSTPGKPTVDSPLNATGAPVLQVVFSGGNEKDWRAGTRGLSARDIAMNVALPEVDGRILSRAVSFKGEARFDESTQCSLVAYEPVPDRIEFVARLAASWLRLGRAPVEHRRLAIILANYPNRDGRLGNGVGLDTPASVVELLSTLQTAGYDVRDIPADGDGLIDRIRRGPTNAALDGREISVTLDLRTYRRFFDSLPIPVRQLVNDRWGSPNGTRSTSPPPTSSPFRHSSAATSSLGCSRRAATTSTRSRRTTTRTWFRPTATSRSMRGCAPCGTYTPSSTRASTATSNGCRARRSRWARRAFPKRSSDRCRTFTRSSSTTPAKAPRPSAGRRRSSWTISRRRSPGPRPTVRSRSWSCSSTNTSRRPALTRAG